MEMWAGISYFDLIRMPSTRRIRMMLQKGDLETERRKALQKKAKTA